MTVSIVFTIAALSDVASTTAVLAAEIIVVVGFLVLLALKECIRAYDGPRARATLRRLDLGIMPLGVLFAVVIALRVATLL